MLPNKLFLILVEASCGYQLPVESNKQFFRVCLCSFLFGCTLKLFCSFHFFIAATQPRTDWHLKENAREHHTSKFSSEELIVRRGQAFTITFNGTERPEQNLIFIAETGMAPSFFHRESNAAPGYSSGPICTTEQQENSSEPACSFTKPLNCVKCLLYYSYPSQQLQLPSVANTWHKFT